MLRFYVFNSEIFVQEGTPEEHKALRELLSFEVPGWEWMVKKNPKLKTWDGRRTFYSRLTGTFPAGLLPYVLKKFKKTEIEAEIRDQRKVLLPLYPNLLDSNLWHGHLLDAGMSPDPEKSAYQVRIVKETLEYKVRGTPWPRGVYDVATGFGKTALAALLLRVIGHRSLYLVERLDLWRQTSEVFERLLGQRIGKISQGEFSPQMHTVSTIQTLIKKLEIPEVEQYLRSVEVVVLDECQNLTASKDLRDRYVQLLLELQNAYFRFGISGSPFMREDMGDIYLLGLFGGVISRIRAKELMDRDLLARPDIRMIKITEPELGEWTPGEAAYDLGIVHNLERNLLVARLAKEASCKHPTMILVSRVAHARMLRDLLRAEGIEVPTVTYKTPTKRRGEILNRFKHKEMSLLLASSIFDVGVDIPSLKFLIIASGGKSAIKAIQRLGRGMRKKEGANRITLIDFLDQTHPFLEEASLRRLEAYRGEGHKVRVFGRRKSN